MADQSGSLLVSAAVAGGIFHFTRSGEARQVGRRSGLAFASTVIDKGTIRSVREVKDAFRFCNRSAHVVQITNLTTSCQCTVATLPKREFAPGESGQIAVRTLIGAVGTQSQQVAVSVSDAEQPIVLELTANYQPPSRVVAIPATLTLEDPGQAARAELEIQVLTLADVPVQIQQVTGPPGQDVSGQVVADSIRRERTGGGYFRTRMTLAVIARRPASASNPPAAGPIRVRFAPGTIPELSLPVVWRRPAGTEESWSDR